MLIDYLIKFAAGKTLRFPIDREFTELEPLGDAFVFQQKASPRKIYSKQNQ
jgi:hypothetical protein